MVGFLTSSSTTRLYRGRAPRQERLTILRAATHETKLGDHDFCLSRSHYTDTDPTCRERAATAGIEPGTSSPGVARSTAELPRPPPPAPTGWPPGEQGERPPPPHTHASNTCDDVTPAIPKVGPGSLVQLQESQRKTKEDNENFVERWVFNHQPRHRVLNQQPYRRRVLPPLLSSTSSLGSGGLTCQETVQNLCCEVSAMILMKLSASSGQKNKPGTKNLSSATADYRCSS